MPETAAVVDGSRSRSQTCRGGSRAFLDFAAGRPECLRRASFAALDPVGALVDLRLQGWPTLVDSRFAAELARASVGVSRLIKSIPLRLFGGDIGRLSRYYELHDTALTALIVG